MTDKPRMDEGWYVSRGDAQTGPYTWEALYGLAAGGVVAPDDLVWHESLSGWIPACQVPGLLPSRVSSAGGAAPETVQPSAGTRGRGRHRSWLVPVIIAAAVVVLGGGGTSVYLALRGADDEAIGTSTTAGSAPTSAVSAGSTSTAPVETRPAVAEDADPALIVDTGEYGPGPANQVLVIMAEGRGQKEAEAVAARLGGTLVGYMDYLRLYQIETQGTTAKDLVSAIQTAEALPEVESVYPNGVVILQEPITGKKCSPLRDPLYDGDNARTYDMIGVQQAWDIIKASGVELSNVHVGVLDSPIYTGSGQDFGTELNLPDANGEYPEGKIRVAGLAAGDTTDQPDPKSKGGLSHGTQVAHVVGADAEGGGVVGILGTAGDKLSMTTNNAFTQGPTTWQAPNPDPNDVTQYNGFFFRTLVELKKQVDDGATVINLSLGSSKVDANNAWYAAVYKRFFEQMQADHPDVLFVCAAGNYGGALDGSNYAPGGLKLPNVMTVGALDQSGDRADAEDWWPPEELQEWYDADKTAGNIPANMTYEQYVAGLKTGSNYATGDGEVTLSACGTGVPTGIDAEGRPVTNHGTSFAAPQVTAAAALLKAIHPELDADDIKAILVETANTEVEQSDGTKVAVPAGVGGKVLRVDKAVLKVINQMRPADDQLGMEELIGLTTVTLIADGGPEEYTVTASVDEVGPQGTDLKIVMTGEGSIGGSTSQSLNGPGEAVWKVSPKEGSATVKVYRSDTGACAVIQLETIDLNGPWEGTLTFTKVELSPELQRQLEEAAANPPEGEMEGCDLSAILAVLAELEGKSVPMTMDITAAEGGNGTATLFIDFSALGGESEPNTVPLTWSGNTITISEEGSTMTGTAARSGDAIVMNGTLAAISGEGAETLNIAATWTVTKQ